MPVDTYFADEWVDVPGLEGGYVINRAGVVRSLPRVITRSNGHRQTIRGRVVATHMNSGYLRVNVSHSGRSVAVLIHRALAEAFIPNTDGLPVVRHLNDNPTDNRLENLAWGTPRDNAADCVRNGHHPPTNQERCHRGHEFGPRQANGRRRCPTCRNAPRLCEFCGKSYRGVQNLRRHKHIKH
jgi:hypothetical protein